MSNALRKLIRNFLLPPLKPSIIMVMKLLLPSTIGKVISVLTLNRLRLHLYKMHLSDHSIMELKITSNTVYTQKMNLTPIKWSTFYFEEVLLRNFTFSWYKHFKIRHRISHLLETDMLWPFH